MVIAIPTSVQMLIDKLEQKGYAAYLVGGCVRDSLLKQTPKDWDIATSAWPEQVIACLGESHVRKTGLRYGTVTAITPAGDVDITTFRIDGLYEDYRRPERVEFIDALGPDLARRDFTINAMAYHPSRGLIDPFGGVMDLLQERICCVGDAALRFEEDALRILRALRLASTLSFGIGKKTAAAMQHAADRLATIAPERLQGELNMILLGQGVKETLSLHGKVLAGAVPVLEYTAWEQTAEALSRCAPILFLRLAILLRSCGIDTAGEALRILRQLRYSKKMQKQVSQIVPWGGAELRPAPRDIRHWLSRLGAQNFEYLLEMQQAEQKLSPEQHAALRETLYRVLAGKPCLQLRDLAVNGRDLLSLGYPPKEIGDMLQILLFCVVDGVLPNEKKMLLDAAGRWKETDG